MALSDDEVKQLADELESRQKADKRASPFRSMTPTTKLLLGAGIAVVAWALFGKDLTQNQKFLLLLGSALGVVFFMGYGESEKRMLTTKELDAKAYEILKWKQTHHFGGEYIIPQGRIRLGREWVPHWRDGKILFWRRRVWFLPTGEEPIEYEFRQDPYTGEDRGLMFRPEGFDGREVLPESTVYSDDFRRQMWRKREERKWE